MQLSLPAATFPTPAATPAGGVKPSTAQKEPADTPTDSFDSLLQKDSPGEDSPDDDGKTSPEAEQAAGILAVMLWMQNPPVAANASTLSAIVADATTTPTPAEIIAAGEGSETETAAGS